MGARRRRRRGWALASLVLASGCAVDGLAFVHDDRLEIRAPASEATVRLPFDLRWTAKGVNGKYLVLFDRTPMRPNQSLLALVSSTDPCRTRPGCPDTAWLAEKNIYVTSDTHLRVEDLPEERTTSRAKDRHEVTIVLLDSRNRRAGESVFIREFIVDRGD